MKIDEVLSVVHAKKRNYRKSNAGATKRFRIYMSFDFWNDCMREILEAGEVNTSVFEFYQQGTIFGFEVFQVPSSQTGKQHEPFEVVTIGHDHSGFKLERF